MKKIISGLLALLMIVTLSACSKELKVTFDSAGGSDVKSISVEKGGVVSAPDAPTKEKATFKCWTLNGQEYDFSTPITEDITLVATWVDLVSITFDSAGGSAIDSVLIEKGGVVKEPSTPTKENAVFKYWALNGQEYDFSAPVTEDITLVASYKEIVTVTFYSEGTEKKLSIESGTSVIVQEAAAKDGYVFDYWVKKGTEEKFDFSKGIDENTELEAKYTRILIYPNSLLFDKSYYEVDAGSSVKVAAVISPADANASTKVSYVSSDPSVASVDANGNVTGVKGGQCIITATTENGKSATVPIYVNQISFIVEVYNGDVYNPVYEEIKDGDIIYLCGGDYYATFYCYELSYVKGELVKKQIDRNKNGVVAEYVNNNYDYFVEWQGGGDADITMSVFCGPGPTEDDWINKHESDSFDLILSFAYKGITKKVTLHYQSKYM